MTKFALAATAALVLVSIPAQAGPLPTQPFRLDPAALTLTVDELGAPSAIVCTPKVPAEICAVLVKGVSQWRFTPGRRDGKPAPVAILLGLQLAAVPKAGGFGIQALDATVGLAGSVSQGPAQRTPPVYPMDDMKRGRTGVVTFEIAPDPVSGRNRVLNSWFDGKPADSRHSLVAAAAKAVSTWPMQTLAPEQRTSCMNIEFSLGGKQRERSATDTRPCVSSYVEGFALPVLLTDPATASF